MAKDVVVSALDGINGTVFAYGSTGSGKTFTITGGVSKYADRGLIPRAMNLAFTSMAQNPDCTYEVGLVELHISFSGHCCRRTGASFACLGPSGSCPERVGLQTCRYMSPTWRYTMTQAMTCWIPAARLSAWRICQECPSMRTRTERPGYAIWLCILLLLKRLP